MSFYNIYIIKQPLLNENLVREIQTVYEFHIKSSIKPNNAYEPENMQIFYLDLKNMPHGEIGEGKSPRSKADCVIKTSEQDLNELIADELKLKAIYRMFSSLKN